MRRSSDAADQLARVPRGAAWSTSPMDGALVSLIGIAGTLLGSFTTYVFQSRTAGRGEAFARRERLRQEQLAACGAFAGALTELKRGIITLWFRRQADPTGAEYQATLVECDRLGASAEAARFRLQLIFDDADVVRLANSAFAAIGRIRNASDKQKLTDQENRFEVSVSEFIAVAAARLREGLP
jgi:hypothetical protein